MRLFRVFKIAGISPGYLLMPLLMAVVATFFEGFSIGMFIPILKGLVAGDYTFLATAPVLSKIDTF